MKKILSKNTYCARKSRQKNHEVGIQITETWEILGSARTSKMVSI